MERLKIEYIPIKELTAYVGNAKEHTREQIDQIKESIENFGFNDPLGVYGPNNTIVEGHGRMIAAQELGIEEVPVIRLDHMSDAERRAYTLVHNKLTMNTDFDVEMLNDELAELLNDDDFNVDMADFGFEDVFGNADEESEEETSEEVEEIEDVEKLETRYGVPYQGNKSRIADKIISVLPEGKRLVDLFGGGGAITHCAMLSGKWESQLYNDINPLITGLFMDAINGKYHDERRVITREEFEQLKDTDAYVAYIWSFGNSPAKGYLWSEETEKLKQTACHALLDESLTDRRMAYVYLCKMLEEKEKHKTAHPELLQSIQALQALQRLEVTNISYKDYVYKDGDVVYCDVPYEDTSKGRCKDYNTDFDSAEFYEWAKTRPYPVYFSSYEISDDSFYKKKVKAVASLIGATTNSKKVNEYIYCNQPF